MSRKTAPSRASKPRQDSGADHARKLMAADSALIPIGTDCRIFAPGAAELHGTVVRIRQGYGLLPARNPQGEYLSADGWRFDYCPGYYAETEEGETIFLSAGMLVPLTVKNSIGHLRLVRGGKRYKAG